MRVTAELEDEHHEHQECHEEMQTVKLRDSRKHKGDYRNAARGIAELAREKETCKYVEDPRRKSRRIDNGHNPLEVRHIIERRGATQVKHHDVYASEKTKTVKRRKVVRLIYCHNIIRSSEFGVQS